MTFHKRLYIILTVCMCQASMALAQDKPIGYWRSHLPYNSAVGVATDGNTLYTASVEAFYTFNSTKNGAQPIAYSKVEGMSDVGMQCVAYDMTTSTTVLVYSNGNIDLFKENENTFYNIPDLKIKSVAGAKSVNNIYTENGVAYLSTSFGVILIDLTTHNIRETYQFIIKNQTIPVNSFIGVKDSFFAVTTKGLYKAAKNNPQLQNFQVWTRIDSVDTFAFAANVNGQLFLANNRQVFALNNDTVRVIYTAKTVYDSAGSPISTPVIQHIDAGYTKLFISEYNTSIYSGKVRIVDLAYQIVDSFKCPRSPMQVVQLLDSSIWIADLGSGVERRMTGDDILIFVPDGPSGVLSYDIYANNKDLWVAHGSYDDLYSYQGNFNGVSNFKDGQWNYYKRDVYHPFDKLDDFVAVTKDEATGVVYMGSYRDGLFILNPDGTHEFVDTVFSPSLAYGPGFHNILGVSLDKDENLWVGLMFSTYQLYAKTLEGNWYKYIIPGKGNGGPLTTDDDGQVWYVATGQGAVVFSNNGTFDVTNDDASYHLTTGVGSGNLPSNKVLCLAKDQKNNIWIGTDNGIGIVSNCTAPFTNGCDAQIPIVQYDQFAGYLFAGNAVRSIAVDGANRKWVGTDDGVWLLSPNAEKIIYRFTVDNSPLPSNHIRKIAIDKVTGDVYFGTELGLVSYRSTATEGGTSNSNVTVFPNPVLSNYQGSIAIKGLAANANVSITDIDGQLVYKTTAYGGQAVWNGKDYKGRKPQSGVYLVFVASSDGAQTYTGKIVFMK